MALGQICSFRHFGTSIISTHLSLPSDSPVIPLLHLKLYDDFVEAIDGIDNGIPQYTSTPAYKSKTDLSSRVSYLNPSWNESSNEQDGMIRFEKASTLAGTEFFERLDYSFKSWLPAREIVVNALGERKTKGGDRQGRVLFFDGYASWKVSSKWRSLLHHFPNMHACVRRGSCERGCHSSKAY